MKDKRKKTVLFCFATAMAAVWTGFGSDAQRAYAEDSTETVLQSTVETPLETAEPVTEAPTLADAGETGTLTEEGSSSQETEPSDNSPLPTSIVVPETTAPTTSAPIVVPGVGEIGSLTEESSSQEASESMSEEVTSPEETLPYESSSEELSTEEFESTALPETSVPEGSQVESSSEESESPALESSQEPESSSEIPNSNAQSSVSVEVSVPSTTVGTVSSSVQASTAGTQPAASTDRIAVSQSTVSESEEASSSPSLESVELSEEEWSEVGLVQEDELGFLYVYDISLEGYRVIGYRGEESRLEIPQFVGEQPVRMVAEGAFRGHEELESIVLPDGLRSIGVEAFAGCTALKEITIPESLEKIGARAFLDTPWEEALSGGFVSINHILYRCRTESEQVLIPEGTRVIADEAFCGQAIQSVVIPEGVTEIGSRAFADCSSLSEIVFPESLEEIAADAFAGTPWMEERAGEILQINTLLVSIPEDCTNLIVEEGITAICSGAASGSQLQTVELPESLIRISDRAFEHCTQLTTVSFPQGLQSIGSAAFRDCTALTELMGLGDSSVVWMGHEVFAGCSALETVELPTGLSVLEGGSFADCSSLQSVTLQEGVRCLEERVFAGCTSLKQLSLPSTLLTICTQSFASAETLAELELPAGLRTIGDQAFAGCSALSVLQLPRQLTRMGSQVFQDCPQLTVVLTQEQQDWPEDWAGNASMQQTGIKTEQERVETCLEYLAAVLPDFSQGTEVAWEEYESTLSAIWNQEETAVWQQAVGYQYSGSTASGDGETALVYRYEKESGAADAAIILQLQKDEESVWGYRVTAKKLSLLQNEYWNVYETDEQRLLAQRLNGSWDAENGAVYQFNSKTRCLTITKNGEETWYRYCCQKSEEVTFLLALTAETTGAEELWAAWQYEDTGAIQFYTMESLLAQSGNSEAEEAGATSLVPIVRIWR